MNPESTNPEDARPLDAYLGFSGDTATVYLSGTLEEHQVPLLRALLDQAIGRGPDRLVLRVHGLTRIAAGGVRCIAFARQRLAPGAPLVLDGAGEQIRAALGHGGIAAAVTVLEPAA